MCVYLGKRHRPPPAHDHAFPPLPTCDALFPYPPARSARFAPNPTPLGEIHLFSGQNCQPLSSPALPASPAQPWQPIEPMKQGCTLSMMVALPSSGSETNMQLCSWYIPSAPRGGIQVVPTPLLVGMDPPLPVPRSCIGSEIGTRVGQYTRVYTAS